MICPEQFTPPAMSFAEQLLSIGQLVSKSSLQYMPLNFQSLALSMAALVCYTAVFSVATKRSSHWGGALRDDSKNGCVADYGGSS